MLKGSHSIKFGIDFRRQDQFQDFNPTIRGRLTYNNLQDLVDDVAQTASINTFLPGVGQWQYYTYYDYAFYVQDEWRVKPNFTLTYGLRYETPGNPAQWLSEVNKTVLANNNNDPRYLFTPVPARDKNNWAPRFGFNYRVGQPCPERVGLPDGRREAGFPRRLLADLRPDLQQHLPEHLQRVPVHAGEQPGGADARQLGLRLRSGLPGASGAGRQSADRSADTGGRRLPVAVRGAIELPDPARTGEQLGPDRRAGSGRRALRCSRRSTATRRYRDQPARGEWTTRSGSGGCAPMRQARSTTACRPAWRSGSRTTSRWRRTTLGARSSTTRARSSIHRSRAKWPFRRTASIGRATAAGRPMTVRIGSRSTACTNCPGCATRRASSGGSLAAGRSPAFLTFQSGAPFSPLNGADPGFRLSGIDALVGNAIRPNVNTSLDLSSMTLNDIVAAGGRTLFSQVTAASPIGNAGTQHPAR